MNNEKVTAEAVAEHLSYGNDSVSIASAYLELGITSSNDSREIADEIEEVYEGRFDSDEDFAQNAAENIGEMPNTTTWPHYCIDWEYAARELMNDYSEQDGYYFRNI